MGALDGKVAVITGASSGIGEATAVALVGEGAKVALIAHPAIVEATEKMREQTGEVLVAEDIAEAIRWTVTQPARVNVNEVLVRPTGQRR